MSWLKIIASFPDNWVVDQNKFPNFAEFILIKGQKIGPSPILAFSIDPTALSICDSFQIRLALIEVLFYQTPDGHLAMH